MITLPIKTLIDRVIELKKIHPEVHLDHVIDELYAIHKEVDEWRSQAIIVGFKDQYDHIAESVLGRPFSDSEWEFGVKDCVENDTTMLEDADRVITEFADGYAHEIKFESEEE